MWVMCLKSGGISDSMGARIGVICGLAGAAFSLSFSHHTREPGLIAWDVNRPIDVLYEWAVWRSLLRLRPTIDLSSQALLDLALSMVRLDL